MRSIWLRLRLLLSDFAVPLMVFFVLLTLIGTGTIIWFVTHPPTSTETEMVYQDTVSTHVKSSATVTNSTAMFPVGTELDELPFYPRRWSDSLTLHAETSIPNGRSARVSHNLSLIYDVRLGEQTIRRETQQLATETVSSQGGTVMTETTLNVTVVEQRRQELARQVSGFGSVSVIVQFTSEYETDQYAGTLSGSGALVIDESRYSVETEDDDFAVSRVHEESDSRQVVDDRPLDEYLPWAGLILLGLFGVAFEARERYLAESGRTIDREHLIKEIQHERYAGWIVTGRIASVPTEHVIRVDSIENLVDIANASDLRVIHDPKSDVYAVIDSSSDVTYYHGQWPLAEDAPTFSSE